MRLPASSPPLNCVEHARVAGKRVTALKVEMPGMAANATRDPTHTIQPRLVSPDGPRPAAGCRTDNSGRSLSLVGGGKSISVIPTATVLITAATKIALKVGMTTCGWHTTPRERYSRGG